MKRFAGVVLALSLVMGLVSCSSGTVNSDNGRNEDSGSSSGRFGKAGRTEDEENPSDADTDYEPDFTFRTTDRNGVSYDESVFAEHNLTMINFFEPWCGPCVGEMGDLEELYENYSSSGFCIIGVYSETTMESDVDQILSDNGITYPIFHYTSEFDQFQSGYVPTTIFVDGEGHIVTTNNSSEEPYYVGANDYESWSAIVDTLLR